MEWTSLRIADERLPIAEIAEQLGDETSTVLGTDTHVLDEWGDDEVSVVEAEIREARTRVGPRGRQHPRDGRERRPAGRSSSGSSTRSLPQRRPQARREPGRVDPRLRRCAVTVAGQMARGSGGSLRRRRGRTTLLRKRLSPLVLLGALALASGACGSDAGSSAAPASSDRSGEWSDILRDARGEKVNWWMFGGDERVNAYVRRHVKPAAARLGITLRPVPVSDTADAVARVVAQRRAGKSSGGSVDLIWINGENFAAGKSAGLWLERWAPKLPNARFLDAQDPSIAQDFQVAVDGQESPWSRAAFVYATDGARVPHPPRDFDALGAWARGHPGRFTYPAPPDFTGSAFVRQLVQEKGEDEAFEFLRRLKPWMYRAGRVLPKSEAELNELFGNGKVDFAMSYDANFVLSGVRTGQFPATARPFLLGGGALTNVSFVTIPADAASQAGAQVVANILLDPHLQAIKADPDVLGNPTVIDLERLPKSARRRFDDSRSSPYLLRDFGRPLQELPAGQVGRLEARWKREILR